MTTLTAPRVALSDSLVVPPSDDRPDVTILDDGSVAYDGGCLFGGVPRVVWLDNLVSRIDRSNRVRMTINCAVARMAGRTYLLDTGIGSLEPYVARETLGHSRTMLRTRLKTAGLGRLRVDGVILTSLDFAVAGGIAFRSEQGYLKPVFPNAKIYVQRAALDYQEALPMPWSDNRLGVKELAEWIVPLDGETEVGAGVRVRPVSGPGVGHQVVTLSLGALRFMWPGGIIPSVMHLGDAVPAWHHNQHATRLERARLLEQAREGGYEIGFQLGVNGVHRALIKPQPRATPHLRGPGIVLDTDGRTRAV